MSATQSGRIPAEAHDPVDGDDVDGDDVEGAESGAENAVAKNVLLGLGFDAKPDEEKRVTRSEDFLLMGGSAATHDRMTEKVLAFQEILGRFGRRLEDLSMEEYYEIVRRVDERPWSWFYGNQGHPFPFGGGNG